MAIGTSPNPLIKSTTKGPDAQKWGGIIADESNGKTSRKGGGDAVRVCYGNFGHGGGKGC
jgi:glutamate synthase (NADPH/NADH) small chain